MFVGGCGIGGYVARVCLLLVVVVVVVVMLLGYVEDFL